MRREVKYRKSGRYLLALLSAVVVASGIALYLYRADLSARPAGKPGWNYRAFEGGTFEASGVAHVPGGGSILFVDDGRPGEVLWMRLDQSANQAGPIKALSLNVNIDDPEGITTDGTHFYVVGSHSRGMSRGQEGIARFRFDPETQRVESVETVAGLNGFLAENVAEMRNVADKKGKDDGLNIEGLAWDQQRGRLLLGLRSPVIDGKALLVAVKLREPRGPFSYDNLAVAETEVIRLPLGGQGVRSIEFDERSKLFCIIAGATEEQDKTDFKLWEWSGDPGGPALREVATLDRKLKPEGITRAAVGNSHFRFVVFDTSRYLRMD